MIAGEDSRGDILSISHVFDNQGAMKKTIRGSGVSLKGAIKVASEQMVTAALKTNAFITAGIGHYTLRLFSTSCSFDSARHVWQLNILVLSDQLDL